MVPTQTSLLTNQMRSLSVTPAQQRHMWMNKSSVRQAGKPWKLEHLRNKHRLSGSNPYGTQAMTEKHRFKSWIEHAEHRKITGHEIRSRRFMSDQKFMLGLVLK